jgi:hypothetical protein
MGMKIPPLRNYYDTGDIDEMGGGSLFNYTQNHITGTIDTYTTYWIIATLNWKDFLKPTCCGYCSSSCTDAGNIYTYSSVSCFTSHLGARIVVGSQS